jgi:hypothetical protein
MDVNIRLGGEKAALGQRGCPSKIIARYNFLSYRLEDEADWCHKSHMMEGINVKNVTS